MFELDHLVKLRNLCSLFVIQNRPDFRMDPRAKQGTLGFDSA